MRILRRKRPSPTAPPAGTTPPLDVEVSPAAYGAIVTIAGELDLATVGRLRAALASDLVAQAAAIVVDLSGVTFMDSTGLSELLRFEREASDRGRPLAIACPEGAARLLLDVTGIAG